MSSLQEKARSADKWIKKKVSWWPTYKQTKKASEKIGQKLDTSHMGSDVLYKALDSVMRPHKQKKK